MRKILFAAPAALLFTFISCNNGADTKIASANTSSKTQKNMEVDDAISKAFETGNANMLDSLISPDFVDHSDMGDKKGIDSLKSMLNMIHAQFKDMKMDRKRQWADDDYVADWVRYTGTNPTAMDGMPAGPYDMKGMELSRFSNGKVAEHWFFYDAQTVAEWMKNMNTGAGKMKEDKSKMKSK
jgi:predicted ester cyclase